VEEPLVEADELRGWLGAASRDDYREKWESQEKQKRGRDDAELASRPTLGAGSHGRFLQGGFAVVRRVIDPMSGEVDLFSAGQALLDVFE